VRAERDRLRLAGHDLFQPYHPVAAVQLFPLIMLDTAVTMGALAVCLPSLEAAGVPAEPSQDRDLRRRDAVSF
jgi:hypothetical protein